MLTLTVTDARAELWDHLDSADDFAELRHVSADMVAVDGQRSVRLTAHQGHSDRYSWASIHAPDTGWPLGTRKNVFCVIKNTGSDPLTVELWVVSTRGWSGVGARAAISPGETSQLSCELRECFRDGTPKLDPNNIHEIRIILHNSGLNGSVKVTDLVTSGAVDPWVRPSGRIEVPDMETGPPKPSRRVRYQPSAELHDDVYGALYLPPDWQPGKRFPVIVEYPGNILFTAGGCWSTGRPEQCAMGYGITSGQDAIWLSLPFVDRKRCTIAENGFGSNAGKDTRDFAVAAVEDICTNWGGDRDNLFVCGFSRGSIACGYIGLADDEIASYWKGIIGCQHYDGSRWNQSNMEDAIARAPRFQGKAIFQVDNSRKQYGRVQDATDPKVQWTWQNSGLGAHSTAMFLDDRPMMRELRQWYRQWTAEE